MTTRLTLFAASLVHVSAPSGPGLDRESSADSTFALVDDVPTLLGCSREGPPVAAMAKGFFDPLSRGVSHDIEYSTLRRSAWELAHATQTRLPRVTTGGGIRAPFSRLQLVSSRVNRISRLREFSDERLFLNT